MERDVAYTSAYIIGEFGIVYKARLSSMERHNREVAVKTLKGYITFEFCWSYDINFCRKF